MTPHKCPVCEGRGKLPWYFYSTSQTPLNSSTSISDIECKSCDGLGLVWDNQATTVTDETMVFEIKSSPIAKAGEYPKFIEGYGWCNNEKGERKVQYEQLKKEFES